MKKISLFLALVSLSVTAASAATTSESADELFVTLAPVDVRAARYTEAEKSIEQSLAALRSQAVRVAPIRAELPSLHTVAQKTEADAKQQVVAKHVQRDGARS